MSQVATRKTVHVEDKDKRTDSPVRDMKKKMAATAEKEKVKQATDKNDKQPERNDKADGNDNANKNDKNEKSADKTKADKSLIEKNDKSKTEKVEKPTVSDKKIEHKVDKNGVEKKDGKEKKEGHDKKDKKEQDKKEDKAEKIVKTKNGTERPKQNGSKQNGQAGPAGPAGPPNGAPDSDDDVLEIADDEFPELAYDEGSDAESPTPDGAPSRSYTRRSQVKAARTPETPQPVTEKPADNAASDDSKESKVPKVGETPNDRKLRSADPREKEDKTPKKKDKENGDKDIEIIEIDDEEPRKPDTNYSKSRVKVSPYRRSMRLADQTTSSVTANYTGNNTTMEMDITESSIAEDSLNDSSYLQGLRAIRGRKSYKQLKEMSLRQTAAARGDRVAAAAAAAALAHAQTAGEPARPTAPVVGRKRKPESDDSIELATEAGEITSAVHSKRMRLLDRIAMPFRRTLVAAHPVQLSRRNPEIVGINTDLPLTAPVASLDPETLKPEAAAPPTASGAAPTHTELPTISVTPPAGERDGKRCVVM